MIGQSLKMLEQSIFLELPSTGDVSSLIFLK